MSDETSEYGPRLMAYVDALLEDRDESPTSFAVQQVGVSASQFGRWRSGEILPRLDTICEIAEALGRPVLEVLAHTVGAVEQLTEPMPAPPCTPEQAIADSNFTAEHQAMLLDILGSFRRNERGEPEVIATSKRRRPNR